MNNIQEKLSVFIGDDSFIRGTDLLNVIGTLENNLDKFKFINSN